MQSTGAERRREVAESRRLFERVRRAETGYARQLRRIARAIDDLVHGFIPVGTEEVSPEVSSRLESSLFAYEQLLRPWAERVGERIVQEIANRDAAIWSALGRQLGISLRREIETAPTGELFREGLARQVDLITSLPREAAERVHYLTTEGLYSGRRAKEIAAEILATGEVTRSRANTIARTEVGRTATELVKARSEHIGSEGYTWVTAGDADVRPDHKRLNGRFFRWDSPPIADRRTGIRAHPGQIWNCRCTPLVQIPQRFFEARAA